LREGRDAAGRDSGVRGEQRARTPERTSAAEYYRARSPERGRRDLSSRDGARGGGADTPRNPEDAAAALSRAHQRAASRWEALDAGRGGSDSESDPEEEIEQLRRQVRARVKAASWGSEGAGTGVAALERRLRGLRGDDDDDDD
jgi:hypothetical protein